MAVALGVCDGLLCFSAPLRYERLLTNSVGSEPDFLTTKLAVFM